MESAHLDILLLCTSLTHSQETEIVICKNLCIWMFFWAENFITQAKNFATLKGMLKEKQLQLKGSGQKRPS